MTRNTCGTVLLSVSALCTTAGVGLAKLAHALQAGLLTLGGHGGLSPKRPELGWEIGLVAAALALIGAWLLVTPSSDRSAAS